MVLAGFGSSTKRRMVSILALALAWVGSFAVRIAPIDEIFQGLGFPKLRLPRIHQKALWAWQLFKTVNK